MIGAQNGIRESQRSRETVYNDTYLQNSYLLIFEVAVFILIFFE